MIDDVLADADDRMGKAIDALRADLLTVRTGRASPALVERLQVDYFNTPTPLQQLASISVPEAQTLVIRPYSPADIAAIEKAMSNPEYIQKERSNRNFLMFRKGDDMWGLLRAGQKVAEEAAYWEAAK